MATWRNDLRHGVRMLGKSPAFAAIAILSLAIGIGANSAIFSVANALILRPLPYGDAGRIAIIWQRSPGLNVPRDWLSIGQYLDIKAGNRAFEQVAAAIGASFNVTGSGRPERVDGMRVSSSFFPLFEARVAMGRVFTSDDDVPGKAPSVILTHGYWQRRFGGDRGVIGKTMLLNGISATIAGVVREDFSFDKEVMPAVNGIQRVDLLLPLPIPASAQAIRDREDYDVFAKLRPSATFDRAQAELDGLATRMKQQFPASYPPNGGLTLSAVPLIDQVVGDVRLALYVLLGAVGMLLLIACGNVGGLLLSRAAAREREMAIRAAVGAERARLLRQLLTEQLVLAFAGGVAGLMVTFVAVQALRSFGTNIPRAAGVAIDGRVLVFTLATCIAATILFGLVPAWRASNTDPQRALNESGGGRTHSGASRHHARLRRYVIGAQIALSLVLLIGATLLARSYARITRANPGFDPRHVLSFRVSLPGSRYNRPELVVGFYDQLGRRLSALPGVEQVGSNYQLPLSSVALAWEPIGVEGYVPTARGGDLIISSSAYVSPDYFRAMGIPLLQGRFFTPTDNKTAPEVAIVDDKLAARFWPHESAMGKRIRQGSDGPWRTIVGVVADTREYEVDAEPPITAFFPVEQYTIGSRFVVVRTGPGIDAASLMSAVSRELRSIDPDLPAYDVATMEQRLHDSLARRRLAMSLLVTFAACAFALAIVGVYGLMAYWVGQRTRDIGIRIALGADAARIATMIAREFSGVVIAGVAAGAGAAIMLTRVMSSMLFGVSATDLATFVAVPLLLAVVATLAAYVPLRRATRVDPLIAIRRE